MKKALFILLCFAFSTTITNAAPLTDFKNNSFQIDAAWNPNNVQTWYNIENNDPNDGITYNEALPNTAEFSGNVTWAFSSIAALRVGATGFAPVTLTNPKNASIDQIGMTQINAQIVLPFSKFFQPFAGLQYATIDASTLQKAKITQDNVGWCVGGQFIVPVAEVLKFNSSLMYGTYMSSAYIGASFALGADMDLDGGYSFEMYNTGKITDNSASNFNYNSTTINAGGLRLGVSIRM